MAQVSVSIAGRVYRMACADGEEEHLRGLGARLDAQVARLRGSFGEIGDTRLVVMAAITLADQLAEAETRIEALRADLDRAHGDHAGMSAETGRMADALSDAVERAAVRLERIARDLAAPVRE